MIFDSFNNYKLTILVYNPQTVVTFDLIEVKSSLSLRHMD